MTDAATTNDFPPDKAEAGETSARKLAIALRAAALGVWEWDLVTDEFSYSDRAKEIFGFQAHEDVTRERIIATMHPDDHVVARDQALQSLDPSLTKRQPYRYRIFRADTGEMRWIHAFGEPEFVQAGDALKAVRFIGTLQDVTEEVLSKERLAYQEARLRLAIEASGVAMWEVDLATETVTPSPELNRLCGFPLDAHPSLADFRSRYAPGERERLDALGAQARARGETKLATEIRQVWPDGTEKWLFLQAQLAPGETNYGGRVIGVLADITEQKMREERQALLVSELKHRIKNSFAVTQAVVNQTLRGGEISSEVSSKLFARLQALAVAHDEIVNGAWESASLASLIAKAGSTFNSHWSNRVRIEGRDVTVSPRAALAFSLVLHELFTNATKYGALSNEAGGIAINLGTDEPESAGEFVMRWTEFDGPVVAYPTHTGFGTRLLDRLLAGEFSAEVTREYRTEGFRCLIEAPLSKIIVTQAHPG